MNKEATENVLFSINTR